MEICKAPTLRLKALNKHTHIMYVEMENVIQKINNNIALRPRKPEGSLGRTAQDGHLASHTAPELCWRAFR